MFRQTITSLASKSSGASSKYQSRPSRKTPAQFEVYINGPVSTKDTLKKQRFTYGTSTLRQPDYLPGNYVRMHKATYTLTANRNGVMTVQHSKINPKKMKWLNVEPDIQKVARSREVREELEKNGCASNLSKVNVTYAASELHDNAEPDWRLRVQKTRTLVEQFPDPNLVSRGMVAHIDPLSRYAFE